MRRALRAAGLAAGLLALVAFLTLVGALGAVWPGLA